MRVDAIPIWALFVGTIVVVMISIEIGFRLGQWMHCRSQDEKESPVGAIAGAILGLAAFMLAFTFSIVSGRYDTRRELVRDDAVAIRTAWDRADFLPEEDRSAAKKLLRDYTHERVTFAQLLTLETTAIQQFLDDTRRMQSELWEMAVANARLDMNSDVAAMYIDALNDVNAVHARRVAVAIQSRVPPEIWLALLLITVLGMVGVGYQTGIAGSKRSMARPILALSFALVIVLIASLDRPDSGVMTVTQQPLIDLRDAMDGAAKNTEGS